MIATNVANAEKLGKLIADRVRERSDVISLWARQSSGMAELWLIVDSDSIEAERGLRRIDADLYKAFPDSHWELRVFDVKLMGTSDPSGFVPRDAVRIEL